MIEKTNTELRRYAASKGVRLWQVAEKFGIAEITMTRWMRKKFDSEKAEKFKRFVDEIASDIY